MNNDSLTRFANILYAEAAEEKAKVTKRLEDERKSVLAKCDAEQTQKFKAETKIYREAARQQKMLTISKREVELMSELRRTRTAAADEVFEGVLGQIREFALSDGYKDYIRREAEKVAGEFCLGTTVCTGRAEDMQLFKELIPVKNLEFETASDDIIGGFTLRNQELGIFADCTLITRLEESRELFLEISGLVIA